MRRFSITVPIVRSSVLIIGDEATASTVSLSVPSSRRKSMRIVCWICISTRLRVAPTKPSISTLTL
jgi:hypothetical protein